MREPVRAHSDPDKLALLVIGDGCIATHPLPARGRITVGRAVDCEIQLDDPAISRRHCIIHVDDRMSVEDLDSANGTHVRDQHLPPNTRRSLSVGEAVYTGPFLLVVQPRSAPVHVRRLWPHDYFEGRLSDECARAAENKSTFALLRIRAPEIDRDVPLHTRFSVLLGPQDVLGVFQKLPAARRQADAPLGPVDERRAETAFKSLDPHGDGRLRGVELACRRADAAVPGGMNEGFNLFDVHKEYYIKYFYENR